MNQIKVILIFLYPILFTLSDQSFHKLLSLLYQDLSKFQGYAI